MTALSCSRVNGECKTYYIDSLRIINVDFFISSFKRFYIVFPMCYNYVLSTNLLGVYHWMW